MLYSFFYHETLRTRIDLSRKTILKVYSYTFETPCNHRGCQCSKSYIQKMCESPQNPTQSRSHEHNNKGQIFENKSNPISKKSPKRKNRSEVKEKGCHWTCGTKMFSKSEKVIKE